MSEVRLFVKHPAETYPIGVDYTTGAPTGAVLLSGVWDAVDSGDNSDATSIVLADPSAVIEGQVAKVRVQAGDLQKLYKLNLQATFDTGDVLHDQILMQVAESG